MLVYCICFFILASQLEAVSASPAYQRQENSQHVEQVAFTTPLVTLPRTGEEIVIEGHRATVGQYWWSGRTGSYYDIEDGWPGWNGSVIAKEFYIWWWPEELAREKKYLTKLNQMVAHGEYKEIQWIIMHHPGGVHLTKTRAFKSAFQESREACDALVESVYEPAFDAIMDMLQTHGIRHYVSNARMLWDEDARTPHLFDFGDDVELPRESSQDRDVKNHIALEVYIAWPNDGISYQDWCVNGQSQ